MEEQECTCDCESCINGNCDDCSGCDCSGCDCIKKFELGYD